MTILQSLASYYDRLLEEDDKTSPFGYSQERIHFCLEIGRDGEPLELLDLRATPQEGKSKKSRPRILDVPKQMGKRTARPVLSAINASTTNGIWKTQRRNL